jgi:uncharacterized protein
LIIILGLIGILVGLISGLTGLGGGIILIPSLLAWFKYKAIFPNHAMQIATNTSIAILFCTCLSNAYQYYQNKLINWKMVKSFLPGLILGIAGGSILANFLDTSALEKSFAIFLFAIVLHLLWPEKKQIKQHHASVYTLFLVSICTGFLAPMFGIGGGILMIPFFHAQGLMLLEAIGSSVFCLLPVATISLISNHIMGYLNHTMPLTTLSSIGFVYWPGLLCIAPISMITAPIGAKIAKKTNIIIIKRILALIIFLTSIQLLTN